MNPTRLTKHEKTDWMARHGQAPLHRSESTENWQCPYRLPHPRGEAISSVLISLLGLMQGVGCAAMVVLTGSFFIAAAGTIGAVMGFATSFQHGRFVIGSEWHQTQGLPEG